jgi:radical SAM superfamily enzyme YgiQ (UPF0313 family)
MRILLIAMPDTVAIIDSLVASPNMGIVSLAGNLPGHEVKCLDLVGCRDCGQAVRNALREVRPQLVGLSAMTFQFASLLKTAALIRRVDPAILIVAGGYHASLMCEALTQDPALPLDFIVRGEGELTCRELADAIASGRENFAQIRGLSHRAADGTWSHAPSRELASLDEIAIPNRASRLRDDFRVFNTLPWDLLETSRGCVCACKFCSITQMYGKSFRTYPMRRIEADWKGLAPGKRAVFIVDDNIGLDKAHLEELCGLLSVINRGRERLVIIQMSAATIAQSPELVAKMREAGFGAVFVGFEAMDRRALKEAGKPSNPEANRAAARILRANRIAIIAGCIFGFPDDDRAAVADGFRAIIDLRPDVLYPQYLTPYPGTELRAEMAAADLIDSHDFARYDGYTCNIRTRKLANAELRRAVQWEIMKTFMTPKLLWGNQFVGRHPGVVVPFAWNFLHTLGNIVLDRESPRRDFRL